MPDKVVKSDAQWRAELDEASYLVTRRAHTERAFTGQFWDHHAHGIYTCVCCGTPLFESDAKFDSRLRLAQLLSRARPGQCARAT